MEVGGNIVFFNEAEAVCDLTSQKPEDLEKSKKLLKVKAKKTFQVSR